VPPVAALCARNTPIYTTNAMPAAGVAVYLSVAPARIRASAANAPCAQVAHLWLTFAWFRFAKNCSKQCKRRDALVGAMATALQNVNIELLVLWPELFGSTQVRAASISWCCSEGCWLARGFGAAQLCDIKTLRLTNDLWRCRCPRSYVILLFAEQRQLQRVLTFSSENTVLPWNHASSE